MSRSTADRPRSSSAQGFRPSSTAPSPSPSPSPYPRPSSSLATASALPLRKSLEDSRRFEFDRTLDAQQSRAPNLPSSKRGTLPKQLPRVHVERFINQLASQEESEVLAACCALDSCPLLDQDYIHIKEGYALQRMVTLLANPKHGDQIASVLDVMSSCIQFDDTHSLFKDIDGIPTVAKMLASKSNRIIELALMVLATCALSSPCSAEILAQKIPQKVVQLFSSNKDSSVLMQALRLISNLASDKQAWSTLHNLQVTKYIIPLLSTRSEDVQAFAAAAVCECILNPDLRDAFCQTQGGLPPLLKLLNSSSVEVVTCACTALANCALNAQVRDNLCTQGAIPSISNILARSEPETIIAALKALGNFSLSEFGKKKVDISSSLPRLIELLQSGDPVLEDLCIRILSRWSIDETIAAQICHRTISSTVLKIATSHESDFVRLFGLIALTNCAKLNTDVLTSSTLESKFLTLIISMIGSPSATFSEKGIEAFGLFYPEESKLISKVTERGHEFLLKLIEIPCSDSLKIAALESLTSACGESDEERSRVVETGVLKKTLGFLGSTRLSLVAATLGLFAECAMADQLVEKILELDVVNYLIQQIATNDLGVQKAACVLAANMTRNENARAVLKSKGVLPLLVKNVHVHYQAAFIGPTLAPSSNIDEDHLQILLMTISCIANYAMTDAREDQQLLAVLEILANIFFNEQISSDKPELSLYVYIVRICGLALAHASLSEKVSDQLLQTRGSDFLADLVEATANPDDEIKFHAARILHNLSLHESTVKSLQDQSLLERLMWGVFWLSDFDRREEREVMNPYVLTAVTNTLAQCANIDIMGDIAGYVDGLLCAAVSVQDYAVRIAAVEIVGRLCRSESYRKTLVGAKAVAVLAVSLCPPSLELQEAAGYALADCCRDEKARRQLLQSGGLVVLVEMVRGAPWQIKASALAALANATLSDDVCIEVASQQLLPLLSELIQVPECFQRIHYLAINCLANLADCEHSRLALVQLQIVQALIWFQEVSADVEAKEMASLAIRNAQK